MGCSLIESGLLFLGQHLLQKVREDGDRFGYQTPTLPYFVPLVQWLARHIFNVETRVRFS